VKILQFVTRLDLGGAQETCLQQCRHLVERGHDVHLLTGSGGELLDDARRIPGVALHVWPDWQHAIRPLPDLRCLVRLARLLRSERFDLLHTHCSKAGILGRLAAILARAPERVVHHIHGWSFNATQPPLTRFAFETLERVAARPGFVLLACSEATARAGKAAGIGRERDYRVVHYGIERPPLRRRRDRAAIRRRLRLGPRDVLYLQLSNLKPQKDPLTLARAAVLAGRRLPRAHFWIAGEGPLRGEAESIARAGGLGTRFRVLGWRRDVDDLLAAADVLVLTSRFEGLPLAVLRALCAGVPVIATAVDGTPEAVEPGRSGWLIPPQDHAAAARAIEAAYHSRRTRLRMGFHGRTTSAAFAAPVACQALDALYSSFAPRLAEVPLRAPVPAPRGLVGAAGTGLR